MARTTEGASESVKAVQFGFLSEEEVKKISVVKITHDNLEDAVGGVVPGGLYDPALGPKDDVSLCQSCDQRSYQCHGHYGHIDLALPVYNPLLFDMLFKLLQKTCLFCHHFRDPQIQVELFTSKLELIVKGDIAGANSLQLVGKNNDLHMTGGTDHSEVDDRNFKHSDQHRFTSLQYKEAMSILDGFMKRKSKKCKRCQAKNPTITCPTFGWMHQNLSNISGRANVILGHVLERPFSNEVDSDNGSSGAVYDGTSDSATKVKNRGSHPPTEFSMQHSFSGPFLPSEVKHHLKLLWENESRLCSIMCNIQQKRLCMSEKKGSYSMFFVGALLVPPIKFRSPTKANDTVTMHPQTGILKGVLQHNVSLVNAHNSNSDRSRIVDMWMKLQQQVNLLFGSKPTAGQRDNSSGICQILDKKEGIFRQNMMGKRVNFSCRSVISPDPYLAVNEIGVPPTFALKLTYPERVTPWNVDKLRNAVLNGPDVHPGATQYTDKSTTVKLTSFRKLRTSISRKLPSSMGVVTQLGKSVGHEHEGKVVYRHLQDGDVVLVNRQPTLHKASIMAHVVRVLKGEKTLRMHYANCSSYNADFDGDEMNVHFPQDEISRAEAYNIVNANHQYIIPTSGDTRRGLIQDHIVSAVLLTKKDTFLSREEYNHLLYSSGVFTAARGSFIGKPGRKIFTINSEDEVQPILPAIWKPEPLWTGKQVITSLLNHITRTKELPPLTVEERTKIPSNYFGGKNGGYLLIQKNEFVDGVFDKAQFGKYGLIHTVQEFYGSDTAGLLLSGLSRLFTVFLQMHGFTCGVDDLLLEKKIDMKRRELLEDAKKIGQTVYFDFINGKDENKSKDIEETDKEVRIEAVDSNHKKTDPVKLHLDVEKAIRDNGESAISILDTKMNNAINELTSKVNNAISLPKGLLKPFPRNCFILMTISGAKGGQVNFTQISSLLGQQSLEGKRVPLMISGKTLPCFPPWESAPRAGGFIGDCFLSGLRPQEYYFHCMAGREGLVDTAVKTSRSGYLQRCLLKNLECLKVGYDHTVRDVDGSVVQFCYGEDGVDVHRTSFMSEFEKLSLNQRAILQRLRDQYGDAPESSSFIKELPETLEKKAKKFIRELPKKQRASRNVKRRKDFMNLVKLKYHSSLAQPGEPVGVIAAQSVGEPSTQMTLNTFHHAGQKESNVTLGIPRLQEILITGSKKMQTPVMTCPLQEGRTKEDAQRLAEKFRKVSIADVVEKIEVSVVPFVVQKHQISTIYRLKMKLFPPELFPPFSNISLEDCKKTLKGQFVVDLGKAIKTHLAMLSKICGITNIKQNTDSAVSEEAEEADRDSKSKEAMDNGGKDDDDNDDDEVEDLDAGEWKRRRQATDQMEYEDYVENVAPDTENKNVEEELSSGLESDPDQVDSRGNSDTDGEDRTSDTEDELRLKSVSQSKPNKKVRKPEATEEVTKIRKVTDTVEIIFVAAEGLDFQVHLRFTNEQHVLLSQVAHKAAKNVYIKRSGNIDQCSVGPVKANVNKVSVEESSFEGLRTSGVDFESFWDMQDDLDISKIYSNDIHAMLQKYGIEAARAAIIKEVKTVFAEHGASVDIRHLGLIADYMTHTGGIRAMNRHKDGISISTSPFLKISFETASKFIAEAAFHGMVDDLESPSARICLGLPVKVGTGSFDLMQKVQF